MSDVNKKHSVIKEQQEVYSEEIHRNLPPIEERYEVIDGLRYDMQPSPTLNHQLILTELWNAIHTTCSAHGTIVVAPMDVYFDDNNIVQPDLIYVSDENSHILKTRIEGVPDLLVEILSPSSGNHDKIRKKELYERFGVQEYWIVDIHHRLIDQFLLMNGKYVLDRSYGTPDALLSAKFPCITIELDKVFRILNKIAD